MKKMLIKFITVLSVIILIMNFCITPSVHAGFLDGLLESVIGLFTMPIRAVAVGVARGINALTAGLAYIEGATDTGTVSSFITPFDVLFNKVKVFEINFFDITTGNTPEAKSVVNQIRLGVAGWYFALRTIAASILLCMLIYVGIRMAITTIATDKAMYKKMLVDWCSSMALLFLLHYIMIFTINVNNAIINALSTGVNAEIIEKTYELIMGIALQWFDPDSIAATVVYCMLVWQTLGLVFTYFNRWLKLAFLTIIAPLVTITYSIDKMGDGKAQALGNWLKEYIYTILIQPFHCVVYMTLIDIGFGMLTESVGADTGRVLAASVISILCVRFTKDAEQLVRKIFAFKDDGSTGLGAGLAIATAGLMQAKNIGKQARAGVNGIRNFSRTGKDSIRMAGRGLGRMATGLKVAAVAGARSIAGKGEETWSDTKSQVRTEMADKKTNQLKNDMAADGERYKAPPDEEINKQADALREANPKMSKKEAIAQVRLNNAKQARAKQKQKNKNKDGKANRQVSGFRRGINKFKDFKDNSSVMQGLGNTAKSMVSMGVGLSVGSGLYGTGSNLSTALATNAAVVKGTREFMQGSRGTLRKGVKDNFKAMGINSQQAMLNALPAILATHSDPNAAKEELDSIMKEIEKALQEAGIDSKVAKSISNTVKAAVKANPGQTADAIKYALSNIQAGNESAYTVNGGSIRMATEKLADHFNAAEIYKSFDVAASFGIKPDTFAADIATTFDNIDDEEIVDELYSPKDVADELTKPPTEDIDPEVRALVEEYEDEELYQLHEAIEERKAELRAEKERIQQEIAEGKEDADADRVAQLEEQIKAIEREQLSTIGNKLSSSEGALSDIERQMEEMYRKQADEIIEQVKKELEAIKGSNDKQLEDNLNEQIKTYQSIKNGITERTKLTNED